MTQEHSVAERDSNRSIQASALHPGSDRTERLGIVIMIHTSINIPELTVESLRLPDQFSDRECAIYVVAMISTERVRGVPTTLDVARVDAIAGRLIDQAADAVTAEERDQVRRFAANNVLACREVSNRKRRFQSVQ